MIGHLSTAFSLLPAAGFYSPTPASPECTPCAAGSAAPEPETIECTPCLAGYFQSETGSDQCDACAPGTFTSSTGAETCEACPAGQITTGLAPTGCSNCTAGTYRALGTPNKCEVCPAGFKTDAVTGATTCTKCSAGTFAKVPRTGGVAVNACNNCAAGTYQPNVGKSLCIPCLAGYVSEAGKSTCTACTARLYRKSSIAANVCLTCPRGSEVFRSSAATECKKCATGHAHLSGNDITCTDCDIGTYSDIEGASTCKNCPAGELPFPFQRCRLLRLAAAYSTGSLLRFPLADPPLQAPPPTPQ